MKKVKNSKSTESKDKTEVRGQPKSGKFWKTPKEKFNTVKKSAGKKSTAQHLQFRKEIQRVKELSKTIKEEKKQENELKRQRREENAQRRQENELKSQTVQIIKNTAKLKRIKKKQLRKIEKRDLHELKSKVV
jgi:rRNA-processing protein CGR1